MSSWVLLRGLMRESRHWGDFPARFERRLPGTHILRPDLPGTGRLYHAASPTTVNGMVEAYRRMLANENIPPPYHLLALSLGAMVATAWAHAYPQEVTAAVLINTSLRPYSPFYRRLRWQIYPHLARMLLADAARREQIILELTSCRRKHAAGTGLLEAWINYQRQCPVSRRNALRQLRAAATWQAPPLPPPAKVLILASKGDALVDPACSYHLAQAWHARFALHPDAGHDLPLDDGDWVAEQVRQWLF